MSPDHSKVNIVTVLMIEEQSSTVWLAMRTDPTAGYYKCYSSPGGRIEEGEYPNAAAIRELKEETGLVLPFSRIHQYGVSVHKNPAHLQFWVYSFYCFLQSGEVPQRTEPDKQGPWKQFSRNNLPLLLTPGTWAILTGNTL